MSDRIVCPTCGKRFKAKPEILGKRVRCAACNEPFVAQLEEDLSVKALDEVPAESIPSRPINVRVSPPISRKVSASNSWQRDRVARWAALFGRYLLVIGISAAVCALLGRESRTVKALGVAPWSLAGVVIPIGIILLILAKTESGISVLMRWAGSWSALIRTIVVAAVLSVILIIGGAYLLVHFSRVNRLANASTAAARPVIPSGPFSAPSFAVAPPLQPGDMQAKLEQKFGAERVVHVHLSASSQRVLTDSQSIKKIMDCLEKAGASNTLSRSSSGQGDVYGGPIEAVDKAVAAIPQDMGTISVDQANRVIAIDIGG